ncbi:hypothetical protein CARUB_v10007057mg, partial [Capsella rubella]
MEEVGEKSRPPGDPPDAPGSWAQKVKGSHGGGMRMPEEVLDAAFVKSRVRLEFPNGEDGEPFITIGAEIIEAMHGLWKNCMVVKVLGRNITIAVLSRRLRDMWNPSRDMFVLDLPRQFFMVRFESEEEYMAALTGGPWKIFGSYLMAQAWSPDFDPIRDEITTTPVWVRLSNIPVTFYHTSILEEIARGLGKPLKVDLTTTKLERARFARVCVEVNLKKPLKGTVMINGERYYVSYEGISTICSHCGLYGHLVHSCPKVAQVREHDRGIACEQGHTSGLNNTVVTALPRMEPIMSRSESVPTKDGFIPARRGGRRPEVQSRGTGALGAGDRIIIGPNIHTSQVRKENREIQISNSFGGLELEQEISEITEEVRMVEANKENVDPSLSLRQDKSG